MKMVEIYVTCADKNDEEEYMFISRAHLKKQAF